MSQNSDASMPTESADRAAWKRAEVAQERHFRALSLHDKWQAVAEAGQVLLLVSESFERRKKAAQSSR
jgi:hypothetical protein